MRPTLRALCALLVVLAGCTAGPSPSAVPSQTLEPTAVPSPTPDPTPRPEVVELEASSDPLSPGRYTRAGFTPRITFAVDGPWYAVQLLNGFFDVQQDVGSPDVIAVQFARPTSVFGPDGGVAVEGAAQAADALAGNPEVTLLERSASRVGGLEGFQLTVENGGDGDARIVQVPPGALRIVPERRLWIAFFDTPDGVLAIMVGGSIERWDAALDAAEPVLESVTIGE